MFFDGVPVGHPGNVIARWCVPGRVKGIQTLNMIGQGERFGPVGVEKIREDMFSLYFASAPRDNVDRVFYTGSL